MQAKRTRGANTARLVSGLMCGLMFGCSSTPKPPPADATSTVLTADQARVFDQGVDLIGEVDALDGRWKEDWKRDLEQRVESADLIAIVVANTLRTDTDPEQHMTLRLSGDVARVISGQAPGKQIDLASAENEPGFETVHEHWGRIENQQFVVYVKWFVNDSGNQAAHFHLSPASPTVVAETEALVARKNALGQPAPEVIVHEN